MYAELVKALRRLSDWSIMDFEDNLSYANQIAEEAADAIEELRAKADLHKEVAEEYRRVNMMLIDKFPQWIPVSERLPENGEYVLCFCRANIVCVLRRDKDGDWYENPTHVYMSGFVTHWMPLPEPPEKESES